MSFSCLQMFSVRKCWNMFQIIRKSEFVSFSLKRFFFISFEQKCMLETKEFFFEVGWKLILWIAFLCEKILFEKWKKFRVAEDEKSFKLIMWWNLFFCRNLMTDGILNEENIMKIVAKFISTKLKFPWNSAKVPFFIIRSQNILIFIKHIFLMFWNQPRFHSSWNNYHWGLALFSFNLYIENFIGKGLKH